MIKISIGYFLILASLGLYVYIFFDMAGLIEIEKLSLFKELIFAVCLFSAAALFLYTFYKCLINKKSENKVLWLALFFIGFHPISIAYWLIHERKLMDLS